MSGRVLLHYLLLMLVTLLVFEGLIRKWLGGGAASTLVFFMKDGICLLLLAISSGIPTSEPARRIKRAMASFALALVPLVFVTISHDPVLGVFGTKQYLLWAAVALAVIAAYIPNGQRRFFQLLVWMALLSIPTTLIAVYQQGLSPSHWLNTSPDGANLAGFSAAGKLRVSSTFSFVAQYCMFLNALCFAIPAAISVKSANMLWRVAKSPWLLAPFFIIGSYITGSRGAVFGNGVILAVGTLLLLVRGGGQAARLAVSMIVVVTLSLGYLRDSYPDFFVAYEARSETVGNITHLQQMTERVSAGLFGWVWGLPGAPASLLGYGLGVMSNGSSRISSYAASWRMGGFWTETDQSTTLFEGGYYLVVIWYGLRLWVITRTIAWTMQIRSMRYLLPACFATSFVTVIGVIGTLSIQAPVAIWWWLAAGSVACLRSFETAERRALAERHQQKIKDRIKREGPHEAAHF